MATAKKRITIVQVFLVIGMLVSLFLVYEHFSPTASKFCTFGNSLDCGIVNKSPYANLDGLSYLLTIDFGLNLPLINLSGSGFILNLLTSNAFLGFLMFVLLFFLLRAYKTRNNLLWIPHSRTLKWSRGLLIFSIIYGFYLFLIQHLVLKTYCIFCLSMDLIILISLIIVLKVKDER
jgi:uncharacterized membrane protein